MIVKTKLHEYFPVSFRYLSGQLFCKTYALKSIYNLFLHTSTSFLNPLKTSQNKSFSNIFRVCRNGILTWNWLTMVFKKKIALYEKWNFPLRISSANVTKSTVSCGFSHIYWRNPKWKTSFLYCVVWTCSDSPGLPELLYSCYCLEYLLPTQLWWQYKVLRVILIFSNAISGLQGYFFRVKDDVIRNTTPN